MESLRVVVERHLHALKPATLSAVPEVCVICRDTGWEDHFDIEHRLWARKCICRTTQPVMLVNCPVEFRGATFETFTPHVATADALAAVVAWPPRGRDLFLYGPTGTGKTRLACTAAQATARPCRFELVETLMRALLADGLEGERWKQVMDTPVLVLDDVGLVDSDWSRRNVTTLYSERIARGKRTIFTSNLNIKKLSDLWGDERLSSRIAGQADVVKVDGPDYRLRRSA